MKKLLINIAIFYILLAGVELHAQSVVFYSDFSNSSLWQSASAVTTIKTLSTSYGTVEYLDLTICPESTKTYNSVSKTGYIDFSAGSSTISTSNAYIKLPALTFSNGGVFTVVYGSGSTGKTLQLQEWTGSSWSNGSYAAVTNTKSSLWYTQSWTISGSGSKIFRLVLASSTHMYVPSIVVTANQSSISVDNNIIDFGSKRLSQEFATNSIVVTGNSLSSGIAVNADDPFQVNNTSTGSFYASATLPATGGVLYAKFKPSTAGSYLDSIVLSSSNVDNVKVYVKGVALPLSSNDSIISFSIDGYSGKINQTTKVITIDVPSSVSLPITTTPVVTLSDSAKLTTSGNLSFDAGTPTSVTVAAEDGTTQTYSVVLVKTATGVSLETVSPLTVSASRQAIVIDAPSDCLYAIYGITGSCITSGKAMRGKTQITISGGMYIVRINSKSYKVIIP
ncbi:MAG: hypothetical protein P4L28_08990 [Paludibacteraceae bacterium]|nr:hypothetical protein [Paludibacteraceae bacterium]